MASAQVRRPSKRKRQSQAQIRKRLMKTSFKEICSQVQEPNNEESDIPNEQDSDMESIGDTEKTRKVESQDDSIYLEGRTLSPISNASPFLDFENNYIISVHNDDNGKSICNYNPPRWMTSRVSSEYRYVINDLVRIVSAIAEYFEDNQQLFLNDPELENFRFDGKLSQKNFIKRIEIDSKLFDEADFSLIKDKIWIVWDNKCLPLETIFLHHK